MNNKYIFYPPINFDMVKIRDIVSRNLKVEIPGLATHQRKIETEPYLLELQKQYPFFSDLYNIYATPPGYCTPIHICPGRGCAINIPITYTEDSYTIFYDLPGNVEKIYSVDRIYEIIESDAVEVFRYTLDRPTLMNTQHPHGVVGGPKMTRVIMSWSINLEFDFETTKRILMQSSECGLD
jgi:hypothetical protein